MNPTIRRLASRRALPALPLLLGLACASPPAGLDAGTILERHLRAHGGAEKLAALQSIHCEGTWDAFSTLVPMTVVRQRPDRYRFDFLLFEAPSVLAYDGTHAWLRSASFGSPEPSEITDSWRRNIVLDAPFGCPLLAHVEAGAEVEYAGEQEVEGETMHTLRVVPPEGPEETWYLDPRTFLETKRVSKTYDVFSGPDIELEMDTFYMNFEDVGGVLWPHREERHFGTRYNVWECDVIEANPDLDAASFELPAGSGG